MLIHGKYHMPFAYYSVAVHVCLQLQTTSYYQPED
jgi:hypothetical protein